MNEEGPKIEAAGVTLGSIKAGVAIVSEILNAGGDDPNVKIARTNLGKTAAILTTSLNVVLLPLAALNYAYGKAAKYFQDGEFEEDLKSKTAGIPEADLVEPKPSIVGPALQGLAYSLDEPNLRDMYLNLIGKAMDGRAEDSTHPAFVEIIKQLSSQEAKILSKVLSAEIIPIVEVRSVGEDGRGWRTIYRNLLPAGFMSPERFDSSMFVDNWERLGLVEVMFSSRLEPSGSYDWANDHPIVSALRVEHETPQRRLELAQGVLRRTNFGLQFGRAAEIIQSIMWIAVPPSPPASR